jgi:hypothetical protein
MIGPRSNLKVRTMNYLDFVSAALISGAMSSLVYVGMVATGRDKLTSLDVDMLCVTAVATFVSKIVARHPEWLS